MIQDTSAGPRARVRLRGSLTRAHIRGTLVTTRSTKIAFYKIDLTDEDALEALFNAQTFDAVIHFAGLKAVGESVRMPLMYYACNIGGTVALLKVMGRHGCKVHGALHNELRHTLQALASTALQHVAHALRAQRPSRATEHRILLIGHGVWRPRLRARLGRLPALGDQPVRTHQALHRGNPGSTRGTVSHWPRLTGLGAWCEGCGRESRGGESPAC